MPRRLPRCVFVDGDGRRCRKSGIGSPSLCRRHYEDLTHEPDEPIADFDDLLDQLANGPLARELLERLKRALDYQPPTFGSPPPPPPGQGYYSGWPPRRPPNGRRTPPPPNGHRAPPPPPPASAPDDPRVVLGFPPGSRPSSDEIRRRRKQIAAIFHPDTGGSDEAMRRVNAAADQLLAELG